MASVTSILPPALCVVGKPGLLMTSRPCVATKFSNAQLLSLVLSLYHIVDLALAFRHSMIFFLGSEHNILFSVSVEVSIGGCLQGIYILIRYTSPAGVCIMVVA